MSKCGKGCMPECEYFTTGGCISPFNCMYKEESGYINSATSGSIIYGTNEYDKRRKENAVLRERLTKTVEIPCKIVYKTCDYDDTLRIVEIVARWIWDDKDNVTKCSMCGKSALYIREKDIHSTSVWFREHYSPYCPHCGAKMELTSEDDNG